MREATFQLLLPLGLRGDFEALLSEYHAAEPPIERIEGTLPARITIREMVAAQSLNDFTSILVAVGGGAGLTALLSTVAKAVTSLRKQHPKGKFRFEKDGLLIELDNVPYQQLVEFMALVARDPEDDDADTSATTVTALAAETLDDDQYKLIPYRQPGWLDHIYDPLRGIYFAPPLTKALPLTDLPTSPETMTMAFVDSGVMTHHPWIKGNITAAADFSGEGIEDRSGHGTVVVLTAMAAYRGLTGETPSLVIAKAFGASGFCTEGSLMAALEWVAAQRPTHLNLSLGIYKDDGCDQHCRICKIVEKISMAGTWVIVAAGNDPDRSTCPHPRHFATTKVGATGPLGQAIESYSGPGATFVAPLPMTFVPIAT